jgi:bifunctional non-homologous end joining protein LigD
MLTVRIYIQYSQNHVGFGFGGSRTYIPAMRWRSSTSVRAASGFIEPCLPTPAKRAPSGPNWLFEIKHDGYRLMVRKHHEQVRVYTRRGADWTERFPRIVAAVRRLKVRSVLLDGEGIVYNAKGMPSFDLLHSREYDNEVSLCAFDLLEHDGDGARKLKLLDRKKRLARLLAKMKDGIEFNEHIEGEGHLIFEHACKLGCEGIVAKRKDFPYESGRSRRWLKIKNPDSPAMKRVEDGTF